MVMLVLVIITIIKARQQALFVWLLYIRAVSISNYRHSNMHSMTKI
jgi:hypothetical protein